MAIWDSVSNFLSGGGRKDVNEGYDKADQAYGEANSYFDPYRRGGREDYDRFRHGITASGNNLDRFNNAGDWMYSHINQSPNQYFDEIMKGYNESPEAKFEQEQALKASTAGASASGMLGSGAFQKGVQENAAGIAGRDRDRYFGNIMRSGEAQGGYLNNLQNQQAQQRMMMQYLTNLGYGATGSASANTMARGNAYIDRGNANAKFDQGAVNDIFGLVGAAARGATGIPLA